MQRPTALQGAVLPSSAAVEAPPTAPTDLAARAQGAAAAGDQWVLAASGALGVALFAAGAVVERTQAARDRA